MSLTATGNQGHDRIVDFRLFHPRMIRPVVHRLGARASRPHPYLKQTPAPGGWKPVHSQARVDFRFTSMHRMHRIFSGDGWLVFPDILKSAHDHCPSQRLLQQPPVLIILCILCIDVQFMVLLDGSAPLRGAGARLAGKREFPKGDRPAFREVARRIPPTSPSGRHPRERGRPARMLSLRLPLSFPAMLQPTALPAGTAWARPKQGQGAAAG